MNKVHKVLDKFNSRKMSFIIFSLVDQKFLPQGSKHFSTKKLPSKHSYVS